MVQVTQTSCRKYSLLSTGSERTKFLPRQLHLRIGIHILNTKLNGQLNLFVSHTFPTSSIRWLYGLMIDAGANPVVEKKL